MKKELHKLMLMIVPRFEMNVPRFQMSDNRNYSKFDEEKRRNQEFQTFMSRCRIKH